MYDLDAIRARNAALVETENNKRRPMVPNMKAAPRDEKVIAAAMERRARLNGGK